MTYSILALIFLYVVILFFSYKLGQWKEKNAIERTKKMWAALIRKI